MKYNYNNLVDIKRDRKGKDYKYFMDSSLIIKDLKWKNNISLNKGLIQTINWYLNNSNFLNKEKTFYIHKK